MARLGLTIAASTVALWAAAPAHAAATEDARPVTIPALRHFRAGEGHLSLRRDARVVFDRGGRGEALTLAGDLARVTGQRVPVKRGAPPRRGDVAVQIGGGRSELGREGYRLRIGRTFEIEADHAAGAFYGGQTLIQLIRESHPVPRGRATDRPIYPERGLMIDLGRRRYRAGWIRREIRQLSYLKLNLLHLHLTDDQRWGIESDRHPELTSPGALTKSQVRSLLAFARRRHVTVVPEIDMPGHMGALLAKHPGLALRKPGRDWRRPGHQAGHHRPGSLALRAQRHRRVPAAVPRPLLAPRRRRVPPGLRAGRLPPARRLRAAALRRRGHGQGRRPRLRQRDRPLRPRPRQGAARLERRAGRRRGGRGRTATWWSSGGRRPRPSPT